MDQRLDWTKQTRHAVFWFSLLSVLTVNLAQAAPGPILREEAVIFDLLNNGQLDHSKDVAKMMSTKEGIMAIRRVGLDLGNLKIRAAFRHKTVRIKGNEPRYQYYDAYYHELAAYVISRYLNLRFVPPTVFRSLGISSRGIKPSKKPLPGSLQLWVENAVPEEEFLKKRMTYPASVEEKQDQIREIKAFDCLIGNTDRHARNVLLDLNPRYESDGQGGFLPKQHIGKYWAIDHSRAFHQRASVRGKFCPPPKAQTRSVSLNFIKALRSWQINEVEKELRNAGLSESQLERMNLQALDSRALELRQLIEEQQQRSGKKDNDFYSSGIWHRVW